MVNKEIVITYKRRRFSKVSKSSNEECKISKEKMLSENDLKSNSIRSTSSSEIKDPMVTNNTVERPKEKYKVPLITFSRRAKRKRDETGNSADLSSKLDNKQYPRESSFEICSLNEQSQLLEQEEVAIIGKESVIKPILADCVTETNLSQEMIISNQNYPEDQSNILIKNSISNLENDDDACVSNMDSSKLKSAVDSKNFMEPQNSSTTSLPESIIDEKTDELIKELEWLEDLERILQDRSKQADTCSFVEPSGVSCKEQGSSSEYMNQFTPLQEKALLTKLDVPMCEKQSHEETSNISSLYRNFLGQSLSISRNKYKSDQITNEASFYRNQNHIDEYNKIRKMRLRESNGSLVDMYSNDWSEEELDSLWIGIRRHGINNWKAILRDPKLRILSSRVVEDLAMQWSIEHNKFLNENTGYTSPNINNNAVLSRSKAVEQYIDETKLSLGDVYRKRNKFNSFRNEFFLHHQMPIRAQRYDRTCENMMHEYQYANNFPHWLKDIRNNTSSNATHTLNLLSNDLRLGMHLPYTTEGSSSAKKSRRHGILKRKNRSAYDDNNLGLMINEASPSLNDSWKAKSSKDYSLDIGTVENSSVSVQNRNYSGLVGLKDLVVIDSDASSEDTISE